jgi:hypothetical protein
MNLHEAKCPLTKCFGEVKTVSIAFVKLGATTVRVSEQKPTLHSVDVYRTDDDYLGCCVERV